MLETPAFIASASEADCLPGNGLVWVQSHEAKELSSLSVEEDVLCLDTLGNTNVFVKIRKIRRFHASLASWVEVGFVGGATAVMTRNHPVHVHTTAGSEFAMDVVMASDIRPGVHSLKTLGGGLLTVASVGPSQEPNFEQGVTLDVVHSERYAVLVLLPSSTNACFAALGSASLELRSLQVSRGCFDVCREVAHRQLGRAVSAPTVTFFSKEQMPNSSRNPDSSNSSRTSGEESADFLLGNALDWCDDELQVGASNFLRVSDVLQLRRQHLSSLGSLVLVHQAQPKALCRPCDFFGSTSSRSSRGEGCKFGYQCPYCHNHPDLSRNQRRFISKLRARGEDGAQATFLHKRQEQSD